MRPRVTHPSYPDVGHHSWGFAAGLGGAARWKANLLQHAAAVFSGRSADLAAYVYSAAAAVAPSGSGRTSRQVHTPQVSRAKMDSSMRMGSDASSQQQPDQSMAARQSRHVSRHQAAAGEAGVLHMTAGAAPNLQSLNPKLRSAGQRSVLRWRRAVSGAGRRQRRRWRRRWRRGRGAGRGRCLAAGRRRGGCSSRALGRGRRRGGAAGPLRYRFPFVEKRQQKTFAFLLVRITLQGGAKSCAY